jgi:hypothetical protein
MRWVARRRPTPHEPSSPHSTDEAPPHLRAVNGMTDHLNAARTVFAACVTPGTLTAADPGKPPPNRRRPQDFNC